MNIFRLAGDMSHLASILVLYHKIAYTRSCKGVLRRYCDVSGTCKVSQDVSLIP